MKNFGETDLLSGLKAADLLEGLDLAFRGLIDGGEKPLDVAITVDDSATTPEDTPITLNVLENDIGAGLVLTNVTALNGAVVFSADETVVYTPNLNYTGPETLTYTISGPGGIDETMVDITVVPVNDVPVAFNNATDVCENLSVIGNVITDANLMGDIDFDVDIGDSSPDVFTVSNPGIHTSSNGTLTLNADGAIAMLQPMMLYL